MRTFVKSGCSSVQVFQNARLLGAKSSFVKLLRGKRLISVYHELAERKLGEGARGASMLWFG